MNIVLIKIGDGQYWLLSLRSEIMTKEKINSKSLKELKEELIEMERLFCKSSKLEGASGWAKFFSKAGVMLPSKNDPIEGPAAIEAAMQPLFQAPDIRFVWEPLAADVSADGSLGYTYGTYHRSYKDHSGADIIETGKYMTIWKRQPDGQWQIEADIGN